jgi:hypothetical protein
MSYCIVSGDNIITNIIVCGGEMAESIGAVPSYDGASIGAAYDPPAPATDPEPDPEPAEEPTVWDELDAAYREGVASAYDG